MSLRDRCSGWGLVLDGVNLAGGIDFSGQGSKPQKQKNLLRQVFFGDGEEAVLPADLRSHSPGCDFLNQVQLRVIEEENGIIGSVPMTGQA